MSRSRGLRSSTPMSVARLMLALSLALFVSFAAGSSARVHRTARDATDAGGREHHAGGSLVSCERVNNFFSSINVTVNAASQEPSQRNVAWSAPFASILVSAGTTVGSIESSKRTKTNRAGYLRPDPFRRKVEGSQGLAVQQQQQQYEDLPVSQPAWKWSGPYAGVGTDGGGGGAVFLSCAELILAVSVSV
uniref:Uncharacterized protein n=1 Tax=Anopheles farauti TaxID=69004 RepID=A0A182QNC4_9DIPT